MRFEDLKYWLNNDCYDILKQIASVKKYTDDIEIVKCIFNYHDLKKILYLETVRLHQLNQKFKNSNSELIDMIRIDNIDELYSDYKFFMTKIFKYDYYICVEYVDLLN